MTSLGNSIYNTSMYYRFKGALAALVVSMSLSLLYAQPVAGDIYFSAELLRSYNTIMLVIDPDTGVILDYSRGASLFYGYPELRGMNIGEINTLTAEQIRAEMEDATSHNRNSFNFRHRLADGTIRDVDVISYPMMRAGESVLVSRISDVTNMNLARRQLETLKIAVIVILSGLVVLLGVLFFVLRRMIELRDAAAEQIRQQLAEKDILLKEVHHRIKNNISSIEQLLLLQLGQITNPEAVSVVQDAVARIKPMTVLYDKLLKAGCYSGGSAKEYLEGLIESIRAVFPHNEHISVVCRITDFPVHPNQLFSMGIILNELFTNIMKYAFPPGADGIVTVFADRTDTGEIVIEIQDNGRGLPEDFELETATGFGLTIVKMLCQQYRGSVAMENRQGTLARVRLQVREG